MPHMGPNEWVVGTIFGLIGGSLCSTFAGSAGMWVGGALSAYAGIKIADTLLGGTFMDMDAQPAG